MATETLEARIASAKQHSPDAIQVLDEIGGHIVNATALLRAAVNTGADEREDECCLISLAFDEVLRLKSRYMELCGVTEGPGQ